MLAGRPVRFAGPAMLRGLAAADGMAVVPPGGLPAGAEVELLELPGCGSVGATASPSSPGH